ncbi:MAG: Gfo/Idh/MocA family oxidoreductase [Kiritimatiellae bacterium]|nr:Gfo/Idh/MocA family oxidoreductase [Kiritimatiellia bacterium]
MNSLSTRADCTRRTFLRRTVAVTAPLIVPASVLGRGRPAPSERIHLACIGFGTIAHTTGRQFLHNEKVQVVAVCDVNRLSGHYGYQGELEGGRDYGRRLVNEHYAKQAGRDPATTNYCRVTADFREILADPSVDAVNISTPDHWHSIIAVEAARAGKHIYCQKPLALTVGEGRAIVNAVSAAGVTFQTGSQQRSSVHFRKACELVRNGVIGKVRVARVSLPGGHKDWSGLAQRQAPEPVPEGLDWNMWLGPAPEREYRPALHPLNWRHNYDYSGGMVTDFGAHHFDIVQWALDMDASGPIRFHSGRAEFPPPDALYNTATSFAFEADYANGTRMIVEVADPKSGVGGVRFEGEDGRWIYCSRGVLESHPEELRRTPLGDSAVRLYESNDHEANFIDCIYSGRPTICPAEVGHRSITIAHLGNILLRLRRTELKWDPVREQIIGDSEASAMLSRPMRAPWSLV